ncbi:hypothetical protein J6590_089198 [Homalodisca vitripennis]|nr:hypothetical protein J6590_089198 [Homalodisca vitripennis]
MTRSQRFCGIPRYYPLAKVEIKSWSEDEDAGGSVNFSQDVLLDDGSDCRKKETEDASSKSRYFPGASALYSVTSRTKMLNIFSFIANRLFLAACIPRELAILQAGVVVVVVNRRSPAVQLITNDLLIASDLNL